MRILGSVVAPSAALMAACDSEIMGCGSIRPQLIRDELIRDKAIFLQKVAHQFERRPPVPPGLDQHVKNFALGIHGTPEVDQATIDLEIDFVETPGHMRLRQAFAKIGRDHGSKMVHPAAHRLIGNQIPRSASKSSTSRKGEPDIKPDRLLEDFGREPVPLVAYFLHLLGYLTTSDAASQNCRDNAVSRAYGPAAPFSHPACKRHPTRAFCLITGTFRV